jgi:hypothetical protein
MIILSIPPWGNTLKCAVPMCDILDLESDWLLFLAHLKI